MGRLLRPSYTRREKWYWITITDCLFLITTASDVDLTSMTLSTFIGGGTQTADGVAPLSVQITPVAGGVFSYTNYDSLEMPLISLPNGDLLFQSESNEGTANPMRFRSVYRCPGKKSLASLLQVRAISLFQRKTSKPAPQSSTGYPPRVSSISLAWLSTPPPLPLRRFK